jgi:hypothetical protein
MQSMDKMFNGTRPPRKKKALDAKVEMYCFASTSACALPERRFLLLLLLTKVKFILQSAMKAQNGIEVYH